MEEKILNAYKENDENAIKTLIKDDSAKEEIGRYLFNLTKDNKKILINGKDKLPEIIKFLDKCGYEITYETYYGNNMLMGAVYHNNVKVVKAILECDSFDPTFITLIGDRVFYDEESDINETDSALKYALVNNNEEIIDLIFDKLEADISEQDFFCDLILDYIDEKDKYEGIEDELEDCSFSAVTTAIMYSSADVVERILSFDNFKLSIYDEMFIDRLDWATVIDADKKKKLLKDKLNYEFHIYNTAIIKNKKCNFVSDKTITLADITKRLNSYTNAVLNEEFATAIKYQVNSDFVDTYDLVLKAILFIIAVELKPNAAENYKSILNNYNDNYSITFINMCNSFIEKEHDLDFIKEQLFPMIEPIFKILMINSSVNYKGFTQGELINILSDWKNLVSKEDNSKILDEVTKLILGVEFDESMVAKEVESSDTNDNNVMFESISNGIPLEVMSVGLSQYRQEYYNAPPRYYSYIGADIVNKNKDCIAENVRITVTFYQDGMIIDKFDDVIGIIQNDSVFHYGSEFYVDEKYDNYSVRINGCDFTKNVNNIDYTSYFRIENLKYRVDNIESETKVSCTVTSQFPNYLRKLVVYVQFLKNKKIVAGNYMVQYDLESYGQYDLIDKFDMAIDCDEVICSIVPIA